MKAPGEKPRDAGSIAVVMSGGGSLGAYEAGAVLYTLQTLAREKKCEPRFHVFAGTSVGAINACFLAANADEPCYSAE
jgi:NTE family protein